MRALEGEHRLTLGHGLTLGFSSATGWNVNGANGCSPLAAPADFYRVVSMLETPFKEMSEKVDEFSRTEGINKPFPFELLVRAGLVGKSDHWASFALAWFRDLPAEARLRMRAELTSVIDAPWASQRNRQLASKELKLLSAPGH